MTEFHFIRPWWLLMLIPLGLLILGLWHSLKHETPWHLVCDNHLLSHLLRRADPISRLPVSVLTLGWFITSVALAGPSWSKTPQPVYKLQAATVIVLDLSQSMDAPDVSPTRLARSRFKILDVLNKLDEGQVALIVYARHPYLVTPLTEDTKNIAELVPQLTADLMPAQGSRLQDALAMADELLSAVPAKSTEILVITDGIRDQQIIFEMAESLHDRGRRLHVWAVGTPSGAPVPLAGGGILKDADGAIVIPKLEAKPLRELADIGGGEFIQMSVDNTDIGEVLGALNHAAHALVVGAETRETEVWDEQGPWLVITLLPLALFGFRRGGLLVSVLIVPLLMPTPGYALSWADMWRTADQQGAAAFEHGEAELAAQLFDDMRWRGVAHIRAGQLEQATTVLDEVWETDSHYNRGNALALLGRFDEAIAAYNQALQIDAGHQDALFNRDVVRQLQEEYPSAQRTGRWAGLNSARDEQDTTSSLSTASRRGHWLGTDTGDDVELSHSANSDFKDLDKLQEAVIGSAEEPVQDTKQQKQKSAGSVKNPTDPRPLEVTESEQAIEQWLRRVPDEPGGLLRRKIIMEYRQKHADSGHSDQPW